MLGDKVNIKDYSFSETCNHNKGSANSLSSEQKNKWRDKFNAANQIKINGVEKKPKCLSGDGKSAYINSSYSNYFISRIQLQKSLYSN